MKSIIDHILLATIVTLASLTILGDLFEVGNSFYRQIIKNESDIQLQITPDMFLPAESFDRSRPYCSLRKISVPSLPKVETV